MLDSRLIAVVPNKHGFFSELNSVILNSIQYNSIKMKKVQKITLQQLYFRYPTVVIGK